MKQSKKNSLLEMIVNQAAGFILAYYTWILIIRPLIKNQYLKLDDAMEITIIFTIISVIRGYIVRRAFNYYLHKDEDMKCSICQRIDGDIHGSDGESGTVCIQCMKNINDKNLRDPLVQTLIMATKLEKEKQ